MFKLLFLFCINIVHFIKYYLGLIINIVHFIKYYLGLIINIVRPIKSILHAGLKKV